jgi:cytochrome c
MLNQHFPDFKSALPDCSVQNDEHIIRHVSECLQENPMSRLVVIVLNIFAGLACCSFTLAVEMPDLAKKNECINCHAINERIVGPAWMDVSKKYLNDPMAEERLMVRVSKGSSGFFGLIHMPANDPDGIKQVEMRALVRFVLGLAKSDKAGTEQNNAN